MNTFSMVFPGQGSQSVSMLSELAQADPIIKKTFDRASETLGYDLWELTQKGPAEQLNQTEFTQPAMLAADVAVFECWCEWGAPLPAVMAGHSLGEYSALVCANALPFENALSLVANRGRYMQEAGKGAMAAIIGLENSVVEALCSEAAQGQVLSPANYNSTGQIVIAGETEAVERAINLAGEKGAKLAKRIPVSVPSHCALMAPAANRLKKDLDEADIRAPNIPVIQNVDVQAHHDPADIRTALEQQLTHPVRWVETIHYFEQQKIATLIECGPGKVLVGLAKRTARGMGAFPTSNETFMQKAIQSVKG